MVVGEHLVVEDAAVAAILLRQVGHREDQDAAGVVGGQVVVDVGPGRILDLDAGHVLLDRVAPDDDVLRLADIDAGVGGADGLAVLDQHVRAEHGVKPVAAVGLLRAAGPLGADVAENEILRSPGP